MELAINKHIVFHNLYLVGTKVLLLNLISFRRMVIEKEELEQLKNTYIKVMNKEHPNPVDDVVYYKLINKKQILSEDVIAEVDKYEKNTFQNDIRQVRIVTINLSYACNLNCKYCYQKRYTSNEGRVTINDIADIKNFLKKFNKTESLTLEKVAIGGGEPLLEENIETICAILINIKSESFDLLTNGINIIKYKDRIDFSKFNKIQVSLDGDDAVISELSGMEKLNVFNRILEGIKYLQSFDCDIVLICMFNFGISNSISDFAKLLQREGIFQEGKNVKMRISIPFTEEGDGIDYHFFSFEEYILLKKIITEEGIGKYISLDLPTNLSSIRNYLYRDYNTQKPRAIRKCTTEKGYSLVMGPKGSVHWCVCKNPDNSLIGNYNTQEINEDLLQELSSRNIFSIPECEKCELRYICSSGCPLPLLVNDENKNKPACQEFANEFLAEHLEEILL